MVSRAIEKHVGISIQASLEMLVQIANALEVNTKDLINDKEEK